MKRLWYRLLGGPETHVQWARDVELVGNGRLEVNGRITVHRGASFVLDGGVVRLGSGVVVNAYTTVWQADGAAMELGDHVYVGMHGVLDGTGGLAIGARTMLGPAVQINTSTHGMAQDRPYQTQPYARKGVAIGANVWIGGNVVILDGVTIGEGAIVGAGAVVTKSIPARTLAFGVPAKVVKSLDAGAGDPRDS